MTLDDAKTLFQSYLSEEFRDIYYCPSKEDKTAIIPPEYDFRTLQKDCKSNIVNQGKCSSGYALSTASVVSDRLCFFTGKKITISAQHVISCDQVFNEGCTRGYVQSAYEFMTKEKIISEECMPYANGEFVNCTEKCSTTLSETSKLGKLCGIDGQESIKREIAINGPLLASIQVYDDFLTYKSGIYNPSYSNYIYAGSQIVKIIGWGEENNRKYWIIENSWGSDWGEDGYARIEIQDKEDLGISRIGLAISIEGIKEDKKEEQAETEPEMNKEET